MVKHTTRFYVDNGAHSIKTLWEGEEVPRTFRNAVVKSKSSKRNYIGDELDFECSDFGGLVFRIPFERGILSNWDTQKTIWDKLFSSSPSKRSKAASKALEPAETELILTEPIMNLPNVGDQYDQMIFEEYEFKSYVRIPGPSFIPYGPDVVKDGAKFPQCSLVVDSGFSFTHVVPIFRGQILSRGVKRLNIGGKLLTNHLKEIISFRQWYMMDQTSVVEKVKETCCFVSENLDTDLEIANKSTQENAIVRTYVLPDFVPTSKNKLGYLRETPGEQPLPPLFVDDDRDQDHKEEGEMGDEVGLAKEGEAIPSDHDAVMKDGNIGKNGDAKMEDSKDKNIVTKESEEQLLHMSNERFTVPELMFNPSIIDLDQAGLAETIEASIGCLPEDVQGMFWANILCVGGNTGFPGFLSRLEREVRALAPEHYIVKVQGASKPTLATILSAPRAFASNPNLYNSMVVTREEYQEEGLSATRRKFGKVYKDDLA